MPLTAIFYHIGQFCATPEKRTLVDIFMPCAIIYACGRIGRRVGRAWRDQLEVGNGCLCYWW